jgi:hypothetical protein
LPLFALCIADKFLPQWYRDPGFSVESVQSVNRESRELVEVRFACAKPETSYWIRSGVLTLDPNRLWAVEQYQFDAVNGKGGEEKVSQKVVFRATPEDLPFVERAERTASFPGGRVETTTLFTRFEQRVIPDHEFTLSAFGLPELNPPSIWRSIWLWFVLVAAGVVCIVAAIFVRRRIPA